MTSVKIITATMDELRQTFREVLAEERRQQTAGAGRLSAAAAATLVHKNRALVLAALASGALVGMRNGKNWKIKPADLDAWATAGFPERT